MDIPLSRNEANLMRHLTEPVGTLTRTLGFDVANIDRAESATLDSHRGGSWP